MELRKIRRARKRAGRNSFIKLPLNLYDCKRLAYLIFKNNNVSDLINHGYHSNRR
jgi:hypothetical protein